MKKKKSKKWIVILLVVIIVIAIVGFLISRGKMITQTPTQQGNTTTYTQASVTVGNITKSLSSSGQISSANTDNLSVHASYKLKSVEVSVNQYVEKGQVLITYTNGKTLEAPYNGVVTALNLPEEGSTCTNSHYITFASTDTLEISLSVSETSIDLIALGQEVKITPKAYSDTVYTGYITSISQVGSYSSSGSSFSVVVTFANDDRLKIGMSATCSVTLASATNVMMVPTEAIMTTQGQKYVNVINEDGSVSAVKVEVGVSNDAYTEIMSGLTGNEKVQMVESSTSSSGFSNMPGGFSGGSDFPSGGFSGGSDFPSGGFSGGSNFPSGGGMPSGMPSGGKGGN